MRYLLMLAGCMSAAAIPAVQAEDWPAHGYYRVQSEGEGAQRLCRFRAECGRFALRLHPELWRTSAATARRLLCLRFVSLM